MISTVYYKLSPPHEQEGKEGDVVISSYGGKSFIYVKTRNKWHQTQELLPKNISRLKESELNATNMLGNLNLGKNRIAALGHNKGIGIDPKDNGVFVDSLAGLTVNHHLYLAKANYSKIYFDGTSSPNDYIMSGGDTIDIFAGGKGIARFQSSTSSAAHDGIVIPIGDKIIFSEHDMDNTLFGLAADDSYYLSRTGTETVPSSALSFYANDENVFSLGNTYATFIKDNYELRFYDGSYHTGFKSHATMTANAMYTLPPAYPASNKILQSDTSGNLTWITDTEKSDEAIQDLVGAMFTSNTETRISATYEDGDGTIDLVADAAPITALNSATENELVTVGATTTELDAESKLTFSGTILNTTFLEVGDDLGTASSFVKQIIGYAEGSPAPGSLDFYKARGSEGSPAVVQTGDYLGTQRYLGYDGNSYELSSAIRGDVDGTVADGNIPGMLNFLTAPTGTLQSRMVINSGGNVGIGTWSTSSEPHNMLSIDGTIGLEERASADTDATTYGQLWVKNTDPNGLHYTDGEGVDENVTTNIAVWGGGFPRTTGADDEWLCIPTGHQGGFLSLGTDIAAPDTSYNPTSTADDLGAVIWNSMSGIRVTACRIWYAQGGSVNTKHSTCLMRYDIDADGTLSNGVEVAGVDTDLGSDDYTTLAYKDLTMTSDVAVTNAQVLIAMVYCPDGMNAAFTAKCVIEYKNIS